jgi:hypothetical protein
MVFRAVLASFNHSGSCEKIATPILLTHERTVT